MAALIPPEVATTLADFRARLATWGPVTALYAGGSLAAGDYRPEVSDLDLVAVVPAPLGPAARSGLERLHQALLDEVAGAARLHCVYVAVDQVDPVEREHPTWASGELYPRALGGIARAELHRFGLVLAGPPVAELLPPVDAEGLRAAVRLELGGYWARAVRRRRIWTQDVYVDLGLFVLARAEVALTEDRLITKREALGRLHRFGAPVELVAQIEARRYGRIVVLSDAERGDRARLVRELVADGIESLLSGV